MCALASFLLYSVLNKRNTNVIRYYWIPCKLHRLKLLAAIIRQQKAQLNGWALSIFTSFTVYKKDLVSLLTKTYLGNKTVSITCTTPLVAIISVPTMLAVLPFESVMTLASLIVMV